MTFITIFNNADIKRKRACSDMKRACIKAPKALFEVLQKVKDKNEKDTCQLELIWNMQT